MNLIGIDPSYKRAGIAIYDGKSIRITCCKTDSNQDKSFGQVWTDLVGQTDRIINILKPYIMTDSQLISEVPPPQGQDSPGLWGLDSVLFHRLSRSKLNTVYTLYPTYLQHVHGKRKYAKSESVELCKAILDKLKNKVNIVMDNQRLSHDESEAVIFLCRLFVINNIYCDELRPWKGLFSQKESILIRRK